jgi:hypothetical protein
VSSRATSHGGGCLAALAFLALALAAGPAAAEGFPPYFGFSGYFGGPTTYYTHDTDVHQTTRLENGSELFGERTYTAGGPFWRYQPNARTVVRHTVYKRRVYRRVRGIEVKG